jgi:hypothetical protein
MHCEVKDAHRVDCHVHCYSRRIGWKISFVLLSSVLDKSQFDVFVFDCLHFQWVLCKLNLKIFQEMAVTCSWCTLTS